MTTHPGGHTETLVRLKPFTKRSPAHANMLAMGCMEKSARAELAGWLTDTGRHKDRDGRMEMRDWAWERREDGDRRTETEGQHRQGMQHCVSLGCLHWPDGSTLRDPGSLVPNPAGTWAALGVCMMGRAAHRTDSRTGDISTQQKHWDAHTESTVPSQPRRVFFHGCCTRNTAETREPRVLSSTARHSSDYLWPGAW